MERAHRKRGFSIVELMVAIFIISSCLLLIIGIFLFLFSSTQKGIDITTGVSTGHMILSKFLYDNYDTISSGNQVNSIESINNVTYNYVINVDSVDSDPRLLRIGMKIYWWDKSSRMAQGAGDYNAQGYGNFSADLVRYLYKD